MKTLLLAVLVHVALGRKGSDLRIPLLPYSEELSSAGSQLPTSPIRSVGSSLDLNAVQLVAKPKVLWIEQPHENKEDNMQLERRHVVSPRTIDNANDAWNDFTQSSWGTFLAKRPPVTPRFFAVQDNANVLAAEQFGIFAEKLLFTMEVLVGFVMYAFVGVATISLVIQAFQCPSKVAHIANIVWPISLSLAIIWICIQWVKGGPKVIKDDCADADKTPAMGQDDMQHLCIAKLNESFDLRQPVTPQSLSEKLQLPQAKAERWYKWFAGGKSELTLNMMRSKAAELHNADATKICSILFEVYDEDGSGIISQSDATEVLHSWCIGKYGAICDCDDLQGLIKTLIAHAKLIDVSHPESITKQEWMRLADKFPEFFDTSDNFPPHVRYLRLMCKLRKEDPEIFLQP